ncbi:MAG: aldose epimerase family protein [Paraglaciecola polaris]|uniref:aldose epimerase family protein n=1 Tax=Paraglaciecola polaris TaxID=222814 RepID=UPI0030032B09
MILPLGYLFTLTRDVRKLTALLLIVGLSWGVNGHALANTQQVEVSQEIWGQYQGQDILRFTLKNQQGMQVSVTNWGAYVTSMIVPDRNGTLEDVVLGYDSADAYVQDCCYNGATVGRYANRIAGGRFNIDGKPVQLSVKTDGGNKGNHLHGGDQGFNKKLWHAEQVGERVEMRYLSVDGEEGYPGNVQIKVIFSLNNDNEFKIRFSATSDKKTPINLISHIYFNLTGNQKRDIEQHQLRIAADRIVEVKAGLLPTGNLIPVTGTPFDLTSSVTLHKSLTTANEQLKLAGGLDKTYGGFDHTWVFNQYDGKLRHQGQLYDPDSGRVLDILTTQPGVQVYTGNYMNGSAIGKQGRRMKNRHGIALETQHFADSVNHANFPSTVLAPGATYTESTLYRFGSRQ